MVGLGLPRAVGPRNRYRLVEQTGEDRLGSLWTALDEGTGRTVTVRLLVPASRQPARAGAIHASLRAAFPDFRDPYAVGTLNYDVLRGPHPFVAMEHINGATLAERLTEPGGPGAGDRVAVVREVGGCLAAAHRAGLTHGALSPDSIVIVHGRAKVMDWGLWPLVVDRLDEPPSRADDATALASIATTLGCAIDVEGGFPLELLDVLEVSRPGRHAPDAGPHAVIDLTREDDVVDVRSSPDADRFAGPRPSVPSAGPQTRSPTAGRVAVDVERPSAATVASIAHTPEPAPERPPLAAPAARPRRHAALAVARLVVKIAGGLILLAILWRAGTALEPSAEPKSTPVSAPVSAPTSASPAGTTAGTTVPDVLGRRTDAAVDRLEGAGLVIDRIVRLDRDATTVGATDPTPGEAVAVGTEVVVYLGEAAAAD